MPDTILTIAELNVLFQGLTIGILGYELTPVDGYSKVRISWPTGGAPAWKIAEDVVFIRILESESLWNRQREVKFLNLVDPDYGNQETKYTRVLMVNWAFYGPHCFDNAQAVRDQMFYELNQEALKQNNLALIPNIAAPMRVPELYQGQWWDRTDLSMFFNEKIVLNYNVPYIKSAEIEVMGDMGEDGDEPNVTVSIPAQGG